MNYSLSKTCCIHSRIIAFMLIILFTVLLVFPFVVHPVLAQEWWDDDWEKRQVIMITERSGFDLTDFSIEFTFEHGGFAQVNGDDIRVVEGNSEVFSAVADINSTHATVVFQTDLAGLEDKIVYAYYGNPVVDAPDYPLVALTIVEGNSGHAIIDDAVYLGWDFASWGWSNDVELWNDFRIDFNQNNDLADDDDLIRDYGSRQGGIGRHRADTNAIGLGEYQSFVQNAIYVDVIFGNATLRVYRNHRWVETTQADYMQMFSNSYTHMSFGGGVEQNITDNQGTNNPSDPYWLSFSSKTSPEFVAYRDNASGHVFASTGLNIGDDYAYYWGAKEASDWDRALDYCNRTRYEQVEPYDQPLDCRIYWYADDSNGYSDIERTATILNNQPTITVPVSELVIQSVPVSGIVFSINGVSTKTPYDLQLSPDSYLIEMPETQFVNGQKYVFQNWTDGNQDTARTVNLEENITLSANYNAEPVADFTYDLQTLFVGEEVSFDASGSFDIDGAINSYSWDFGDGTSFTTTSSVTSHIYGSSNTYNVTLNVEDNAGLTSVSSETILVKTPTYLSVSTNSSSTLDGFQVGVNGYLLDNNGIGVNMAPIILSYTFQGIDDWVPITSNKTNTLGTYSITWFPPATGYYQLKVEWNGNSTYGDAHSITSISTLLAEDQYVFSVESNSTISGLSFNSTSRTLSFNTEGDNGTQNYAKITVADDLVSSLD
ncbi:MAG: hypothetical protein CW691_11660, partial [Candidatus Bathyarchaeum sp.]